MAIRIEKIKVNREGPLKEDFVLESGDINLIYGHNATGKTYIVESIINLLFRVGKKLSANWALRGWGANGNVIVSGLQATPISFTKTGRKIEDYWSEEIGLPHDFSRLLVVKAGETSFSNQGDGVGRDFLRTYLSGEGILDGIDQDISATAKDAFVENGKIFGPSRGELKERESISIELKRLDDLLEETENAYVSGSLNSIRQQNQILSDQLETLQKAKRYYASKQYQLREENRAKAKGFPSEQALSDIESKIPVYHTKKSTVEDKSDQLSKMSTEDDRIWAEKAIESYKDLITKQASLPNLKYIIWIFIALASSAINGILHLTIPFVLSIATLIFISLLYYRGVQKAYNAQPANLELVKLKEDYKTRFKAELTSGATLEAQVEKLREDRISARNLKEEIEKTLIPEMKIIENEVLTQFKQMVDGDILPQDWSRTISEMRGRTSDLTEEIHSLDVKITQLGVLDNELLYENPGIEWDAEKYASISSVQAENSERMKTMLNDISQLKVRVAQETQEKTEHWAELITALQEKRKSTIYRYKQITAKILAHIQVTKIIRHYKQEEDTRIATGLEREELTNPLHAVTGHYNKIRHEEDSGLVLNTDEDNEYPLSDLSTGTQEQIFIAMRMGFSSIAMKGQSAFLILDDAFQHSDWPRRENLITQILGLRKNNWQIFYFSMDDHIRDLFLEIGPKMDGSFISKELI